MWKGEPCLDGGVEPKAEHVVVKRPAQARAEPGVIRRAELLVGDFVEGEALRRFWLRR